MISELDFKMAVGQRLSLLRAAMGKSQADFGRKIGVGGTAISNYENGTRALDPFDAFKLKSIFAVPLEWLYTGDESAIPQPLAEKLDTAAKAMRAKARAAAGPLPRSRKTAQKF